MLFGAVRSQDRLCCVVSSVLGTCFLVFLVRVVEVSLCGEFVLA